MPIPRIIIRFARVAVVGALAIGCADRSPPKITNGRLAEGVYCVSSEVSGYTGTTLELKDGGFRYWFYSDVGRLDEPEYPIAGNYEFQDGKVLLLDDQVGQREWFVDIVNGTPVLWRDDALEIWLRDQKIYDYGVLVWTGRETPEGDPSKLERPSIRILYSPDKQKQIKEWQDPFVNGAQ